MADISYNIEETIVTVDGNDYVVPGRTEKLEKLLKAHDAKVKSVSQYTSDYELVEIILGKDAAKKIFPKGEEENLDRMHYIAMKLSEVYYESYKKMEDKNFEDSLEKLGNISDKVGNIANLQKLVK